jgi:ribonuclease HI
VDWKWIKGHAGHAENERCDQLAVQARLKGGLPPDTFFEAQEKEGLFDK